MVKKTAAKSAATDEGSTKVVTGMVRFSYAHVWEAVVIGEEGTEKKFSASLIIPKSDKATVAKIEDAIQLALDLGKKSKFDGKTPAKPKLPLRDGDEERPDDEAYADSWFVNATSKTKPGVVDKDVSPIMDQDEFYSGCYGRASINFYPFNTKGNKGVACGLNHVQKLKDGEPLGGRTTAEEDFGSEEMDEDFG